MRVHDQPRPRRNRAIPEHDDVVGRCSGSQHARHGQDPYARTDHGQAAEPVRRPADDRAQRVHAGDVDADDETDELQADVDVTHVHGRHHHDHDHDGVPERDGRDAQLRPTVRTHVGDAVAQPRVHAGGGLAGRDGELSRDQVGIGTQQQHQDAERDDEAERRDDVRAGELRQPEVDREPAGRLEQVGSEHGTDGRRPDDDRQRPRPTVDRRQVGRGVAGLIAGRRGAPHQQATEVDEREHARHGRDDDEDRSDRPEAYTDAERAATSARQREPREGQRRERGPGHPCRLSETGRCIVAGDPGRQQRTRGNRSCDSDPRQRLVGRQHADRASLDRGNVERDR